MPTLYRDTTLDALRYLVTDIEAGRIALPDIQRPFVWSNAKARDLFDSMYRGYGFLNAEGGKLLIGVADNGQVVGLEDDFETLAVRPTPMGTNSYSGNSPKPTCPSIPQQQYAYVMNQGALPRSA